MTMLILIPFCSCNLNTNRLDEDEQEIITEFPNIVSNTGEVYPVSKLRCTAKSNENFLTDYSAFRDDNYIYFVYNCGTLYNVELTDSERVIHSKYVDKEEKFIVSQTDAQMIENTAIKIATEVAEKGYSETSHIDSELKASGKIEFWKIEAGVEFAIKNGLSKTGSWNFSNTTSIESSFTSASEKINSTTQEITVRFNENYPEGNYLYMLMGDLNVYNVVLVDTVNEEFVVSTFTTVKQSHMQLVYLGPDFNADVEYENLPIEVFNFRISNVMEQIERDISGEDNSREIVDISDIIEESKPKEWKPFDFTNLPQNCADNNGYDYNTNDDYALSWVENCNLGYMTINGSINNNGVFEIVDYDKFNLVFSLTKDPYNLGKVNVANFGDREIYITNDNWSGRIYNVEVSEGKSVGYGLCVVTCYYDDNTQSNILEYRDFFKNKASNSKINVTPEIDRNKNLIEINVTIVYKMEVIVTTLHGSGVITGLIKFPVKKTPNWRYDYSIKFN